MIHTKYRISQNIFHEYAEYATHCFFLSQNKHASRNCHNNFSARFTFYVKSRWKFDNSRIWRRTFFGQFKIFLRYEFNFYLSWFPSRKISLFTLVPWSWYSKRVCVISCFRYSQRLYRHLYSDSLKSLHVILPGYIHWTFPYLRED